VVNPVMPAAVAARGLTGFRMANAVFGALAQIAPDRVFACEVGGDTGGPGKFRGGLALERQYRFLEAEGTLQLRTDRRHHLPYGLAGGRPGTPSRNVLNPGPDSRELPAKCTLTVRHGDVYRHELAGAGGWGDPFSRDPEHVLRDVLEEKISVAYARREYGVAIDERTWTIVAEETARLRAAARIAR